MPFMGDYLTCPNCEGNSFKEYTLDLVVNKNVRVFQDGEVDYADIEVDGFATAETVLFPERKVLFYTCEICKTILVFKWAAKKFGPPVDLDEFLKIVQAVG